MGTISLFILMRLQIRKTRKVVSLATKSERRGPSIYYVSTFSDFFYPLTQYVSMNINVTLVVEMKDKEFTSHKAKDALQFGTNNNMIGLSLTFKSIKQKIQFSQHSELISYLMF